MVIYFYISTLLALVKATLSFLQEGDTSRGGSHFSTYCALRATPVASHVFVQHTGFVRNFEFQPASSGI